MPLQWEEAFEAEFAHGEALLQLLPYFCACDEDTRRSGRCDPISNTVVTMLTSPVRMALSEVGMMPFYGASRLLYPFNLMSEGQKAYVRACLAREEEWNVYNDTVVFRRSKAPLTLSPAGVLTAMCAKVFDSGVRMDEARRTGLCNILLQRVQGYVRVDKPVQQALNAWLRERRPPAAEPAAEPAAGI